MLNRFIFFLLIYFNLSIANGLDLSFGLEYPFKDLDENITCVWGGGSTDDGKWTENETMPLAISLKPFNMKDRKEYFWHDELFFEQPEDLFTVILKDVSKGMFNPNKVTSKEFVGIIKDDGIIGVQKWYRAARYDPKSKISYMENDSHNRIYIDFQTGYFSYAWHFGQAEMPSFVTRSNIRSGGFLAKSEFNAYGYCDPFKINTETTKDKPIYVDKDPNQVVAAASGSGFFINANGHLITNNHVVDGCSSMKVLIDGKEYQADVVATDNTNDIALLKSEFSNKDFFNINTEDVERSESVKAIGFGFGKSYSSDIKVTAGIVSSLAGFNDNYSEFQMDAAIQSGNSGGPVINESGDVVGMSVAALNSSAVFEETGTMPQNVNYAIKASTLKQFLDANNAEYELSEDSWFSFGSASNSEINKKIDAAAVYLSCYMTYAEIEESMNKKAMFENIE